jgi:hypothetical protein
MLAEKGDLGSLYNKPGCKVVLKAFSVSKNNAAVDILLGSRGPQASYIEVSCSDAHEDQIDLQVGSFFFDVPLDCF